MAENEQERTATEMASQAINAMNPNTLELRNAATGGVPDVHEAASRIQGQMQQGEEPSGAVAEVLDEGDDNPASFMQLMYEQAAESDTVERVRKAAGESAEGMQTAGRQAGQTLQQVGQQALNATMNLVERARDFAMEVSESLWGDTNEEKDKI